MNQIRFEPRHCAPHRQRKPQEKTGKAEAGQGRQDRRLVQTAGVRHPLERLRSIPEAVQANSRFVLHCGGTRRVRSEHFYMVTLSGGASGYPLDKRAGGVSGKAGIVVREREYAHRASRHRSR
jgi:hypothetical protein